MEKNGYPYTDRLTHIPNIDPAQYNVLGWVKTVYQVNLSASKKIG